MLSDHQLKKRDIETLKHWLQQKYGGYKTIFTAVMANNILYRGVRCEQRPITISRISYPPVDKVTTCQRLNRVGQPRFYCSAAAPAVFYELRAKEGDRIALSQWEVTEPFWVRNLGYHPHALRQMGTQRQSILMRERLTNPIPNETKENYRIRRQLAKAFAADVPAGKEYRYKQSMLFRRRAAKKWPLRGSLKLTVETL